MATGGSELGMNSDIIVVFVRMESVCQYLVREGRLRATLFWD
jgi:hypothetical protein